MKKILLTALALLALFIIINQAADYVIYSPLKEVAPMPSGFEEVQFNNFSDIPLYGAFKPAKPGKDTILFFHGNAGNISYYIQFADIYSSLGYGVFMFDYRGFGKSEGKLNEKNFYEDAVSALDYLLLKKNIPPQNIILFAHSLGNAALIEAGLVYNTIPFKALIMQSPFTNTPDMAASFLTRNYNHDCFFRRAVSALAYPFLANKMFNNIAKINELKNPVFMLYSRQDMLIPWQMSDALFKNAPKGSKNYISQYGGHNNFEWAAPAVQEYLNNK